MVTSVSAAGPVTGVATRPDPQDVFKRLDTQGKGYLTPNDLASAIVKISAKGAELSQDAATAKAQAIFRRLDANGDGQVTQAEFTQAAAQRGDGTAGLGAGSPAAAGGQDGGPAKAAKPAVAAGPVAATAGSSPIYAPADANRDGTVTVPEQYAYDTQQAPRTPKPTASSAAATDAAAARSAVQAYSTVDQFAAA